jgi:hypothetical protein
MVIRAKVAAGEEASNDGERGRGGFQGQGILGKPPSNDIDIGRSKGRKPCVAAWYVQNATPT